MEKSRNLQFSYTVAIALIVVSIIPCSAIEMPNFQSGIFTNVSQINSSFNALYEYVNNIYEVEYRDDEQIAWNYTTTTKNWAWVYKDGKIAVLSTEPLNISNSDILESDLNNVIDNLNTIENAAISGDSRNKALDSAMRYAIEPNIYHKILYPYSSDFDLNLFVPDSKIIEGRLYALGSDNGWRVPR